MNVTVKELAKMIDHSLLHPMLTDNEIEAGCRLAVKYDVASVCVKPYAVNMAHHILKDSDVSVGCVVGFPHGNSAIAVKVFETQQAVADGAVEIDMVVNIGKVLQEDWEYVSNEINAVTEACHKGKALIKVIFENDYLPSDTYKIKLCKICSDAGVDFIKTSSGYGFVKQPDGSYNYKGATIADLILMRKHAGPHVKIKAAGGVRTLDGLLAVKEAGAVRCGASATQEILEEAIKRFGK